MNNLSGYATIVVALVAMLGVMTAVSAWFYRRGGQERSMVDALNENTKSNKEVATELKEFKGETLAALRDHDWQLKIHDQQLKQLTEKLNGGS